MREFAKRTQNIYSETYLYDSNWEVDMMSGCQCDFRHSGFDCSLRECPTGDDPLTTGQVNEIQLITCISDGVGSFILTYQGYNSKAIQANDGAAVVKEAIMQIPILTDIDVTFSVPTSPVCSKSVNVVTIEFSQQFGIPLTYVYIYTPSYVCMYVCMYICTFATKEFHNLCKIR